MRATGRGNRCSIQLAASELGWGGIDWEGESLQETGCRADTVEVVVRIDQRCFHQAEVEAWIGDPNKAKEKLSCTPTTTLEELVAGMVATDQEEASYNSRGLQQWAHRESDYQP